MITANDLKRAEKLLRELPYMESALAYYNSLADAPISDRVRRALNHDRLTTTLIYAMADKLLAAKRKVVV